LTIWPQDAQTGPSGKKPSDELQSQPMSHIKTAQEMGIRKALEEAGYASFDDVIKEAQHIGLVQPTTPAKEASLDKLIAGLSRR